MKVAIISDIHGNLPALEAVAFQIRHADAVMCLGDVVNYGPWNDDCLELLHSLPDLTFLEGNHEAMFLGTQSLDHELPLVQQFFHASISRFSRRDLIENLPLTATVGGYVCMHTLAGKKIYENTQVALCSDCILGHTHHAFRVERNGHRLVNPGSVGLNRKQLDIACYAILDTVTRDIVLEQVKYPVSVLLNELRALDYPVECLAYYESKL